MTKANAFAPAPGANAGGRGLRSAQEARSWVGEGPGLGHALIWRERPFQAFLCLVFFGEDSGLKRPLPSSRPSGLASACTLAKARVWSKVEVSSSPRFSGAGVGCSRAGRAVGPGGGRRPEEPEAFGLPKGVRRRRLLQARLVHASRGATTRLMKYRRKNIQGKPVENRKSCCVTVTCERFGAKRRELFSAGAGVVQRGQPGVIRLSP